jgi:phosphatidylinositol alpha-1,6-mannosyltransferase
MRATAIDVLGLFPGADRAMYGGIQASGTEAWEAILGRVGAHRADRLVYDAHGSKAAAVWQALRIRRTARIVLVWHLHLLKLIPFVNRSQARVVVFLHGIEAWHRQSALTRQLLRGVDTVLTNTEHTWTRFLAWNPSLGDSLHLTVHLGTGSTVAGGTPPPATPPAVLMLGRLSALEGYKGHRQMIEAWPLVLERRPDALLWIAGDGDLRASLEGLARRTRVGCSVRFFGAVSRVDKDQLIAQCRCLALPSRGEGFGLVYLEAMRLGRPCLVSDVDAGREVVNPPEAGLAVNPDDPAQLAGSVHRLLAADDEWSGWSERARARYDRHFTASHFRQRLLSALFEA